MLDPGYSLLVAGEILDDFIPICFLEENEIFGNPGCSILDK
jgi:hypothetical protein